MPPIGVVVNACEKKKILGIVSTAIDNASATFPLLFFCSHTVKANEVANQFLVCSACIGCLLRMHREKGGVGAKN